MKRFTCFVLACAAASAIALATLDRALADDQPAAATNAAAPAGSAATEASISLANAKNPFEMLSPDGPELEALYTLAKDGFIKDNLQTLADHKPITRYQASIIAAEAITNAETMLHNSKTVAAVSPQDMQALQRTFESFKGDLATLKGRVDTLDTRVTAIEKSESEMHNEMTQLNQTVAAVVPTTTKQGFELHGEFRVRPVNSFSNSTSGTTIGGAPLLAGSTFTRTGAVGDNGLPIPIGNNGFGQQEGRLRLVGTGHMGDNATFIIRLSAEENAGDTGSPVAGGPLGAWVHNDFDFFQYNVPKSGLNFYGGKLLYCCNTPWLPDGSGLIADAVPIGMALKWTSANTRWSAWGSVGSLKNAETSPTVIPGTTSPGLTQNITAFHVGANLGAINLGYQYVGLNSQQATNFINSLPVSAFGPVTAGSLWVGFKATPLLSGQAEYLDRYGNDPTTNKGWEGPGAFLFDLNFGGSSQYQSSGRFRYADTGKNSTLTGLDPIINGVDSMWNAQFLSRSTNLRLYELGYSYRFDKNGHLDLDYGSSQLRSNEVGIDGSTLTRDQQNLFVVTTGFNF